MKFEDVITRILIPDYKELNLFQFGIVFIFLFIAESDLRDQFALMPFGPAENNIINLIKVFLLILFFSGSILSIGNALMDRKKPELNKWTVLCFSIFINFFIAIVTIRHLQNYKNDLLLIFPGINLIHAGCIVLLWRAKLIKTDIVSDEDADFFKLILSFIIIVGILIVMQLYLNRYWAITFTIAITYSVMLNNVIVDLIKSFRNLVSISKIKNMK